MRLFFMCLFFGFFFGSVSGQQDRSNPFKIFESHVRNAKMLGDEQSFIISSAYKSAPTGILHIYFSETINGLTVVGTESSLHINGDGLLVAAQNHFLTDQDKKQAVSARPGISERTALLRAVSSVSSYTNTGFNDISEEVRKGERIWQDASENFEDVSSQLVYFKTSDEKLQLSWQFDIQEKQSGDGWTVLMDANSGDILERISWKHACFSNQIEDSPAAIFPQPRSYFNENDQYSGETSCSNCYEVIPLPFESPYETDRQIVESPMDPEASYVGWHQVDNQVNRTTDGNNAIVSMREENGFRPDGGAEFNFTGYDWNGYVSEQMRYESASATNLFYLLNKTHDILYHFGFNEDAGNFQQNNPIDQGEPRDRIQGIAQYDPDRCNASLSFGRDGTRSVMRLNICRDRDGVFDSTVVIHEYGHGIYGRITGGPASRTCSYNAERPTEGIADWYAAMLTMKATDTEDKPRRIGKYFYDQGIDGPGIRDYPFSTDIAVNPQTYASIDSAAVPHGVGAVWGNILWEITWELINAHGYNSDLSSFTGNYGEDAGNIMALALVTEALKFQPCQPGFVDARDAMLQADAALYKGQNNCALWKAFAKRGLGIHANQGSVTNIHDNYESFDMPIPYAQFNETFSFCFNPTMTYPNLSGGKPVGGRYSGPGVEDHGNGLSFDLNLENLSVGTHEIIYEVFEGDCTVASSEIAELYLTLDDSAPVFTCPDPQEIEIPDNQLAFVESYAYLIDYNDECDPNLELIQDPLPGEVLEKGENYITMSATDVAGHSYSCQFLINVLDKDKLGNSDAFHLYPNPTSGVLFVTNKMLLNIDRIRLFDVQGRLIKTIPVGGPLELTEIAIGELASGLYFALIQTPSSDAVRRFIKK